MFYIPKYLNKTDVGVAFIIGTVCAAVSTGPVGIGLSVITTVGQWMYIRRRYKKEVEYANTVNPIMMKSMMEYYHRVNK